MTYQAILYKRKRISTQKLKIPKLKMIIEEEGQLVRERQKEWRIILGLRFSAYKLLKLIGINFIRKFNKIEDTSTQEK